MSRDKSKEVGGIRVSPTFLNQFVYYMNCESNERAEQIREEIINRINGVRTPTSEAAQRGIDFEKSLCDYCDGTLSPEAFMAPKEIYEELAQKVRGAMRQVHISFPLTQKVTVHGYIDFWNGKNVYDLKTTRNYDVMNVQSNYENSYQHRVYLCATAPTGSTHFEYLITDFKSVFVETYEFEPLYIKDIEAGWQNYLQYLRNDSEMRKAYEDAIGIEIDELINY